ncbi:class II aldolase/adducin family protein [Rhodococcus sp. LB1]|uniref:class II aldolase/adducin family protein n=1 Tax=Rhodococcus sp. LB1 TaxID=1807499 RepID=UPI0009EDFFE3
MTADDVVMLEGDGPIIDGSLKSTAVLPSSLACHTKNDATAVVHTHSPVATAVSLLSSGGGYLVHRRWLRSFGIEPRSLVVASRPMSDSGSGGRSSTTGLHEQLVTKRCDQGQCWMW